MGGAGLNPKQGFQREAGDVHLARQVCAVMHPILGTALCDTPSREAAIYAHCEDSPKEPGVTEKKCIGQITRLLDRVRETLVPVAKK